MALLATNAYPMMQLRYGVRTDRATSVTAQSTTKDLFTVAGGRVVIHQIIGMVTTATPVGANNTKLIAHPAAGTDVDLCATADIASQEVGAFLTITGTPADALVKATAGASPLQSRSMAIATGTIRLSCDASKTGAVQWTIFWMPLDDGASVVAA